ncbi:MULTISPECIES: beta-galactosidase family protein [Arthrobacter]|uniref:Beta-galactosidase n=2 Tax=Arthrobacter TaxID=1663 RepID=A0ABU9KL19_9MICC|nr:beta-galactosidase family protein [Arthrobacter sp. YJM1]MDP5227082.1 beta-galactosidase [Arthrobacter sp. YJM1]
MPAPILSISDARLLRRGREHRILAGAIHYFRVHPDLWEDRLTRLKAMGANTVDTYVAWNFHQERREDPADFSGWRDLGRFIDLAGELGLDVIVRPGPYICAEWDNGGFPSWLTGQADVMLRSTDPRFREPVAGWLDVLVPVIASRQACNGGPVVAVQVENEYGSYGDSAEYIRWNAHALRDRGITETLFTADGGTDYYLDGGAVPEIWATATLGSRGDEAIDVWKRRRPDEPFFNVEFWGGWFDHWGEEHHVRPAEEAAAEVRKMLDAGGSVCVYMAHGGTNFGLGAGANEHDGIQPTVTSYDSDAPIAENGALTEKFHALRAEFLRAQGLAEDEWPALPAALLEPAAVLPPRTVPLPAAELPLLDFLRARLDAAVDAGSHRPSERPLSFEELGLHHGLLFQRATAVLPGREDAPQEARIKLPGLHDRAHVWVDGELLGILDDTTAAEGLLVQGHGREAVLEILVENVGRINYGPHTGQRKGLLGGVLVNQRFTLGWEHVGLDPSHWDATRLVGLPSAEFPVDEPADTYLALPGSTKGFVWINGFLLGRYWEIGPQETLYVPAPLLRPGVNTVHVFELGETGGTLELREKHSLGTLSAGAIAAAELA